MLKQVLSLFIALLLAAPAVFAKSPDSYGYPIADPFVATVVGTPEPLRATFPDGIPIRTYKLPQDKNRDIPEVFWYSRQLKYSAAYQDFEAPLIFVIAGTGSAHNSAKNKLLMKAFYQQGYHVVGITSPTHINFLITSSTTRVPGDLYADAQDLYRVMQKIRDEYLKKDVKVSSYSLTGYSLGGTQAAFVAELDEYEKDFDFRKVLMINPSLALYNSVSKLDRMLESVPGGMDHFNEFFNKLVKQVSAAYKRSDTVEFNEELVYRAFKDDPPSDGELAAIIGAAFRMASANMIFASDVMTNYGFIKPSNVVLTQDTSLTDYLKVGMRVGFTDYYHTYMYPYYRKREPSLTRETLAERNSLREIQDYLLEAKKIGVVHNQDDIILTKGEIDFFPLIFGDRATIYPHGGHLGNMEYTQNVADIVAFITE